VLVDTPAFLSQATPVHNSICNRCQYTYEITYDYVVRFLSSFLIDARGGTVHGSRHAGVRIIIPPGKVCMPTRITCKLVRGDKLASPPQLKEGEAIVSRGLELGPVGFQFNGFVCVPCWSLTDIVDDSNLIQYSTQWCRMMCKFISASAPVSAVNADFCFFLNISQFLINLFSLANVLSPVRLSVVCLSVTFVRRTQAVQIFGNISTALGTLATH